MGYETSRRGARTALGALLSALLVLLLAVPSQAALFHPHKASLDVTGLSHACGVAVDSKGDLYVSSAGDSKIKIYNPSHVLLTEISDVNTPCGLAVNSEGHLFVSERSSGEVVRFKPNAYPFVGTPTFGSREVIDSSKKAKGIATDRVDNRLYVAEGDHVAVYKSNGTFEVNVGEGKLTEATGVAPYTYSNGTVTDHFLWVADANGLAADKLYLFTAFGAEVKTLALRRELSGASTPDGSFGFGTAGAYLAADPGNRSAEKCVAVGKQACTAGHLFLYDAAHKALDEFDASGEYLDRTAYAGFADAEPTAVAIDRSGGTNDGTLYVTAGAGTGARALAFAPLEAPSRAVLGEPLSRILENAKAVATDRFGDTYVVADTLIFVFNSKGEQVAEFEDEHKPRDIAVDSACNVYVLDDNELSTEAEVTYYAPSQCQPEPGTSYERHEPPIATPADFPAENNLLKAIAVNPGPVPGKDRLFVLSNGAIQLYDTAAKGSKLLNGEFGKGLISGPVLQSIAVDGARGIVYVAVNASGIYALNEAGTELLRRFDAKGSPSGKTGANPFIAVDQANGHVLEFDGKTAGAREYDAAGSFVAEFGVFTEGIVRSYRVAVDSSCALHEPPLDETTTPTCKEFDPANGTAYVAFDDTNPNNPPYDLNAFGPLKYPETPPTPKYKLTIKKEGTGSGTVTSEPAGISCSPTCSAEFAEGTEVTLTAKADPENEFLGWGTGCEEETVSAIEGTCTVTKEGTITTKFTSTGGVLPLKVVTQGPGSGEVTSEPSGIKCPSTCSENFGKNVKVILTAKADPENEFLGWSSGCEEETVLVTGGTCTVKMSEEKEVKAEFDVEHPLLTVTRKGTGSGAVSSKPAGIDCGSECSAKFDLKDSVILKAKASAGSKLEKWLGCDKATIASETEGTCEVTMTKPREVTATFTALPQVVVRHALVGYDEATLRGEVDPVGLQTEYRFEYMTEQEFEDNGESFAGAQHTPTGELAPTKGFAAVEASLLSLDEATEYRFRLRAMNSAGSAEDEGSFETLQRRGTQSCANAAYRFGLSANLPDCRAYELVTPAQTDGLTPYATNDGGTSSGSFSNWFTVQRGAAAGERVSYFTDGTLPGFEGNGRLDGYRAERGAGDHPVDGWQSALFAPSYAESAPGLKHSALQHGVAADQLYSIWEFNPEPETFPETLPHGVYLRTPEGFEVLGQGSLGEDLGVLSRYLGPGGAHAIFTSRVHLEEEAPPAPTQAVYDRAAGASSATVVSTPPPGASTSLKAEFESQDAAYAGASEDGAAVAFSVGGILYLHRDVLGEGITFEIAGGPNTFAGISEDGTRVFYAAGGNGEIAVPLFVCDTEAGPCAGPGAHPPEEIIASGIFAQISPDGSHAFFSSTEALSGSGENENEESAQPGARNLYVWDGAEAHFVAGLSAADFEQKAFAGIGGMNLKAWTRAISLGVLSGRAYAPTRSTPEGTVFVFQSHARLTAYDNEGIGEIYRYDPSAEAGGRLLCISCGFSGASPTGGDALLEDVRPLDFVPIKPKTMVASLTDDGGTVFFQSFDRLLPEDANEAEDVYEWQAMGTGGCGRPTGCLALISSGQGEVPSILYAMSADGHDVFFHTKEKLVGADVAGSPSIYDARVGGGIPESASREPCQGDACQGQGSEPPALPSPATTGAGGGNEDPPARPPCGKGKHRVKGRCVPVKHRKHHKHHKRRAHANRGGNR